MSRGAGVAVLVAGLLALAPGLPAANAAAPPGGGAAAAGEVGLPYPVQIRITALGPTSPRPGQTLALSGTMRNSGAVDITDASILLRLSPTALVSRAELDAVARQSVGVREGYPVAGTEVRLPGTLASGQEREWSLRTPVDNLSVTRFGVYALGVEVQGATGSLLPARQGVTKTFLPWAPKGSAERLRLGLLWPLTDRPVRDSHGIFLDDHLARELQPDGRLSALLRAATQAPGARPTLMVDADLLATIAAMQTGYRVQVDPGTGAAGGGATDAGTVAGTGGQAAARWLARLRSAVSGGAVVVALPYADVDLAALAHGDRSGAIEAAVQAGSEEASALLGQPVGADLIWPARGFADERLLSELRRAGVRTVVLSERALPLLEPAPTSTPSAPTDVPVGGGRLPALTIDSALSAALADGARGPLPDFPGGSDAGSDSATPPAATTDVMLAQRFLAETAVIAAERPGEVRTVLAAPPRRWNPDATFSRQLLSGIASAPWLRPVEARAAARGSGTTPREELTYPASASQRELSSTYLSAVARTARASRRFLAVLTDPAAYRDRVDTRLALLRAQSSAWRGHRRARNSLYAAIDTDVREQRRRVRIISRGVTLSSRTGTIPVTVANDLDQAVVVRVSLRPRNTSRLQVRLPPAVRIEAGRKATVPVPARAVANGVTIVDAQLRSATGRPYAVALPIEVRATNYGAFAGVVVAVAAGLLFLTAGLRLTRRLRAARRARRDSPPDGRSPAPASAKVGA